MAQEAVEAGTPVVDGSGGRRGGKPITLAEGDSPLESLQVFAATRYTRCYLIDGHERISWQCRIAGGYDIVFSTRVSCAGHQHDAAYGREVTERERASTFSGYVDFRLEHKDWFATLDKRAGPPVLVFDFDNSFSYFTGKDVELRVTKIGDITSYNDTIASCEAKGQWEHAFGLLGRMRDVGVAPDLDSCNAVLGVCMVAKRWENALKLLNDMKLNGPAPDARSYINTISACESDGHAELALQLMDEMDAAVGPQGSNRGAMPEKSDDLDWFKWLLSQTIDRCPRDAHKIREHLLAAQLCAAEYSFDE